MNWQVFYCAVCDHLLSGSLCEELKISCIYVEVMESNFLILHEQDFDNLTLNFENYCTEQDDQIAVYPAILVE